MEEQPWGPEQRPKAGLPRWARTAILVVAVLILLAVAMMMVGRGGHVAPPHAFPRLWK